MKLGERLLKQLDKIYEPTKRVAFRLGRYNVAIRTDDEGNPILAFVGKASERGIIRADHFNRHLVKKAQGVVIKDHWDYKGKVQMGEV